MDSMDEKKERKEDISLLVNYFLKKYSQDLQKHVTSISDEALKRMVNYDWPGNVRELQNVIERAILITDSDKITIGNLPEAMKNNKSFQKFSLGKRLSIEDYTKALILEYQASCNEQQIAAILGITRKSLWEKRKKWGLGRK